MTDDPASVRLPDHGMNKQRRLQTRLHAPDLIQHRRLQCADQNVAGKIFLPENRHHVSRQTRCVNAWLDFQVELRASAHRFDHFLQGGDADPAEPRVEPLSRINPAHFVDGHLPYEPGFSGDAAKIAVME